MRARNAFALVLALGVVTAARPLRAQLPADTAGLTALVARVFADSLLDRLTPGPIAWVEAPTLLNEGVARLLQAHPKFRSPIRDPAHTLKLRIRDAAERRDTTWVVAEFEQDYGGTGPLTFYVEERAYLFTRDGSGWRFIGWRRLRHLDGGYVRG